MATDVQNILRLSVPVIVLVGESRLRLDEVLSLGPGAILELDKSSEDELAIQINNKHIGMGLAVKVGENFGVRVTKIGSPRDLVEALGPASSA